MSPRRSLVPVANEEEAAIHRARYRDKGGKKEEEEVGEEESAWSGFSLFLIGSLIVGLVVIVGLVGWLVYKRYCSASSIQYRSSRMEYVADGICAVWNMWRMEYVPDLAAAGTAAYWWRCITKPKSIANNVYNSFFLLYVLILRYVYLRVHFNRFDSTQKHRHYH